MTKRRQPLFLARHSYRQRRLADAARLLPILGAILMAIPLLWPQRDAPDTPATSIAMIYVFGVWLALIVAAALLARRLEPQPGPEEDGAGQTTPTQSQTEV